MKERLDTKIEKDPLEQARDDIYALLEGVPEKDRKEKFKEILLNEYDIPWKSEYEAMWEEEKKTSKGSWRQSIGRVLKATLVGVAGTVGIIAIGIKQTEKKKSFAEKDYPKKEIQNPTQPKTKEEQRKQVDYHPRFKIETYGLLPEKAREVYVYFAEYDPSPGKGYMILDKKGALIYIFNEKNELVEKVTAGYGQDAGDEQNTSYKYNTGKMTTPAGMYLVLDTATKENRLEYGELGFSLYGRSVRGDTVDLGMHSTYPKELAQRTEKLTSTTTNDNNFSNGCINISSEDFKKKIKPYISGGELFFVLPDWKSQGGGTNFKVNELVKSLMPTMIDIINKEEAKYRDLLSKMKTEKGVSDVEERLREITSRRIRAQDIIAGK